MDTKLTVRLDGNLIRRAKSFAAKRGTSLSQLIADFFTSLEHESEKTELPPKTRSLYGLLEDKSVSEADYRKHLAQKHS